MYEHLSVYAAVPDEIRGNHQPVALWYLQQGTLLMTYPLGIV